MKRENISSIIISQHVFLADETKLISGNNLHIKIMCFCKSSRSFRQ
jgi:hypothetical protein